MVIKTYMKQLTGRIKQLIEDGIMPTSSVRLFVLDEADKLLEDNFQESINWIYSTLPENKQMMALSATYPEVLAQHLTAYMRSPTFVRMNSSDPALLGIRQYVKTIEFHPLPQVCLENKINTLVDVLSQVNFSQCLVFCNYQLRAQSLSDALVNKGWPAAHISGAQDQKLRLNAIDKLKKLQCRVMVSTDLTARGIDAEHVNMVINFDVPRDHETYLHRIGRAGRFGTFGAGVTIACSGQEMKALRAIEQKCNTVMKKLPEPIPADLAKSSGFIAIDDLVTIEPFTASHVISKTPLDDALVPCEATDKDLQNNELHHNEENEIIGNTNTVSPRATPTQQAENSGIIDSNTSLQSTMNSDENENDGSVREKQEMDQNKNSEVCSSISDVKNGESETSEDKTSGTCDNFVPNMNNSQIKLQNIDKENSVMKTATYAGGANMCLYDAAYTSIKTFFQEKQELPQSVITKKEQTTGIVEDISEHFKAMQTFQMDRERLVASVGDMLQEIYSQYSYDTLKYEDSKCRVAGGKIHVPVNAVVHKESEKISSSKTDSEKLTAKNNKEFQPKSTLNKNEIILRESKLNNTKLAPKVSSDTKETMCKNDKDILKGSSVDQVPEKVSSEKTNDNELKCAKANEIEVNCINEEKGTVQDYPHCKWQVITESVNLEHGNYLKNTVKEKQNVLSEELIHPPPAKTSSEITHTSDSDTDSSTTSYNSDSTSNDSDDEASDEDSEANISRSRISNIGACGDAFYQEQSKFTEYMYNPLEDTYSIPQQNCYNAELPQNYYAHNLSPDQPHIHQTRLTENSYSYEYLQACHSHHHHMTQYYAGMMQHYRQCQLSQQLVQDHTTYIKKMMQR